MSNEKEVKVLVAQRGYVKATLTRLHNDTLQDNSDVLLRAKLERLVNAFQDYEELCKNVLALDSEDKEDYSIIEGKYYAVYTKINSLLASPGSVTSEPDSQVSPTPTSRVKLPTIHIPHFDGKYTEYTPFINLFSSIVNRDKTLDNVQKLYYLRSFLRGEPFDIIKNMPLTESSYEEGLKLLDERYNNTYKITSEHINALLDLNSMVKSSSQNIRDFVSQVKQILAALRNLGLNVDSWDDIVMCILIRKLDSYTSRAYQLERGTALKPSTQEFLQYLEKRALALENAEPIPATVSSKPRVTLSVSAAESEGATTSGAAAAAAAVTGAACST